MISSIIQPESKLFARKWAKLYKIIIQLDFNWIRLPVSHFNYRNDRSGFRSTDQQITRHDIPRLFPSWSTRCAKCLFEMWFTREIVSEKSVLGVVFIVLLEWSNRQNDMRHGCAVRKATQSRKKLLERKRRGKTLEKMTTDKLGVACLNKKPIDGSTDDRSIGRVKGNLNIRCLTVMRCLFTHTPATPVGHNGCGENCSNSNGLCIWLDSDSFQLSNGGFSFVDLLFSLRRHACVGCA